MTQRLYEGHYGSSDIWLTDNELAPGQILRNDPPLTLECGGNGCEDGSIDLTREMAVALRDALAEWLLVDTQPPPPERFNAITGYREPVEGWEYETTKQWGSAIVERRYTYPSAS